jgi:hypothetical protein
MMKMKRKIVWQADVFDLIAPAGAGKVFRAPVGFVFDPHEPFILGSRVFPPGANEAACLTAAVEEAMLTYRVTPTEVHVKFNKGRALDALAAKAGFTLTLCDELRELAAVRDDMAKCLRGAFETAEPKIN